MDDESSVDVAEQILVYLKSEEIIENQAVILVANKTDLVRSREVSSNGNKSSFLNLCINERYLKSKDSIKNTINKFCFIH